MSETVTVPVPCSFQTAEDPKKKVKHIKDLWATLKLLRVTPQDHSFGPDERQVVEEILSGSRDVHEKQRQGFEAPWTLLNRCCPSMALHVLPIDSTAHDCSVLSRL